VNRMGRGGGAENAAAYFGILPVKACGENFKRGAQSDTLLA
jgi:hypothetical protein